MYAIEPKGEVMAREKQPKEVGRDDAAASAKGLSMDDRLARLQDDPYYLNLSMEPVTDLGLAALAKRAARLKQLNLRGCKVTVKGFRHVATYPVLEVLRVTGEQLTEEVAQVLMTSHSLRRVEVKGTPRASGRTMTDLELALRRNQK